jgi:hypothetical protein
MVGFIAANRRGDIVLAGHVSVGKRIQACDSLSNRVKPLCGNAIARERLLRKQVYGRKSRLREVSLPLEQRRYIRDLSDAFVRAASFVVAEEERTVLPYRSANRKSELVLLIARRRFARGRKVIPCVKRGVSEELPHRAVYIVTAGLEDDIDLTSGIAAE